MVNQPIGNHGLGIFWCGQTVMFQCGVSFTQLWLMVWDSNSLCCGLYLSLW